MSVTPLNPAATQPTKSLPATKAIRPGSTSDSWLNLEESDPSLPGMSVDLPPVPGELPAVPGYKIIREIGRGGMGVVYQAVQQSLNRAVALKMILRGNYATTEERLRFLIEAEMLARVKHPNIVQVFEAGTHDGFPFLTLELVDGGTLTDFTQGKPQPPVLSAELLALLADAVQAAHHQGIIHRDLKPGNVLLHRPADADSSPGSEPPTHLRSRHPHFGVPKITDFGLAKRFDDDSHLTTTGHVLGTPSYMSPEQAQGKRQVGPAADIYALGAILYELLTGEPPFRGANSMETLHLVMHEEPAPLSRSGQQIPRDLAVICLKCLEKAPERRYRSAADLAADLQRFLRDEPISARPVSRTERWVRWCRRHPDKATLLAALAASLVVGIAGIAWKWREAEVERAATVAALQSTRRFADLAQGTVEDIHDRIGETVAKMIQEAEDLHPGSPSPEMQSLQKLRAEVLAITWRRYRQLLLEEPNNGELKLALVRVGRQLGPLLRHAASAGLDAKEILAASEQLLRELLDSEPSKAELRMESAKLQEAWGVAQMDERLGRDEHLAAKQRLQKSLDLLDELANTPLEAEAQVMAAATWYRMYLVHSYLQDPVEDRAKALHRFTDLSRRILKRHPESADARFELGHALRQEARFAFFCGNCAEAVSHAQEAEKLLDPLLETGYRPGVIRLYLYSLHEVRAKCAEHEGELAQALAQWRAADVLCPTELRNLFLTQYGYCAAHAGEVRLATELAGELRRRAGNREETWLNQFCIFASAWQTAVVPEEEALCAAEAAKALALLQMGRDWRKVAQAGHAAEELEASGLRQHPLFARARRQLDLAGFAPKN